jgi:hypothetical protein
MRTGPPSANPNWFCRSSGFPVKCVFASNASFRANSKTEPVSLFVPLLLTILIWLGLKPYYAE